MEAGEDAETAKMRHVSRRATDSKGLHRESDFSTGPSVERCFVADVLSKDDGYRGRSERDKRGAEART